MKKQHLIVASISLLALAGILGYLHGQLVSVELVRAEEPVPQVVATKYHHATIMRQEFFDTLFVAGATSTRISGTVTAGVVPHHLAAGVQVATFFDEMSNQQPPVVVILGPNHKQMGRDAVVTSQYDWQTPYGTLTTDRVLVNALVAAKLASVNEEVADVEWSVAALTPFVKHTWPNTQLVPLMVRDNASTSTIQRLAEALQTSLPTGSLVLTSVDFSHYLSYFAANFHDVLSVDLLTTGSTAELAKAEIDSQPSLYFLMAYNRLKQAEAFHLVAHTNSAMLAEHLEWPETTSHLIGYYTAGPASMDHVITMQFFGDIMLDRNVARVMGARGLEYLLEKIRGTENRFFEGVHLFMANLEGAFAPARVATSKSIAFRFEPKWAKQLKAYHFDAVSLANNHSLDMGAANDTFTRQTLEKNRIGYCGKEYHEGAGLNLVVGPAEGFAEKIVFVCFENVVHTVDRAAIVQAIETAKSEARYVIVQVHSGTEYRVTSIPKQQELYHWLIDQGVTAVIGHHPHVVEEVEIYQGRPIVYSLGNFIFDQYFSKETQEGLSVGVVLGEGRVRELHFFPFFGVKSQVELMTGSRRAAFLEWLQKNSHLGDKKIEDGVLKL